MELAPTSEDLRLDSTRPYFLWWTDAAVGDLRAHLSDPDPPLAPRGASQARPR
jgi:hypothetical protein